MITVKDSFFNEIYNLVNNGEDIYIITADLGAASLDKFRHDFKDRYISVGIAEQNLISVAAGMALTGKKIIAYGLNPFPITRAFDQIRILLADMNIPLTICVLNSGLCAAECGYTHMPIEDMSMIGSLYNVNIYNPTDAGISKLLADDTRKLNKPRIIRFDKGLYEYIYDENIIKNAFCNGYIVSGNINSDTCIVSYGIFIKEFFNNKLYNDYPILDLYNFPINNSILLNEIKKYSKIVICEESNKSFGIGSYISGILQDNCLNRIKVYRFALDFSNGYPNIYTNRDLIKSNQNIDIKSIVKVLNLIKNE